MQEPNGNSETDKIVNLLYSMSFLSADIFKIYGWSFEISKNLLTDQKSIIDYYLQTINYSRSDRHPLGHQIQKVFNSSISPICNTVGYLERMPHSWPVTVSITPERMYTCLSRRHISMGIFWLLNSNLGRRALKRKFFQNLNVLKFMYFWSYVQY